MILVTGASQGIGLACARELLERTTDTILITGRSRERLVASREMLPAGLRTRLEFRVSDQSRREDVDELVSYLSGSAQPLAGAILGVGVNPVYTEGPRRLHDLSPDTIEQTIRTNCTHLLLLSAPLLARFRRQHSGTLIWIGSQAPRCGLRGAGVYCATKSFLSGLAAVASNEYGGRGVRIHLVHPAVVRTPRTHLVADRFAEGRGLQVTEPPAVARRIVDLLLGSADMPVEVNL